MTPILTLSAACAGSAMAHANSAAARLIVRMRSSRSFLVAVRALPPGHERTALLGVRQPGSQRNVSCAGGCSTGEFSGFEIGRQHDLQHFGIVRIVEHLVLDAR